MKNFKSLFTKESYFCLTKIITMNILRSSIFLLVFLFSCKNENTSFEASPELSKLESEMQSSKDPKIAQEYLIALNKVIQEKDDDKSMIPLLKKGLEISKQYKLSADINAYLMMLVRKDKEPKENSLYIYELASRLKSIGKFSASDVLFQGFIDRYPNDEKIAAAKSSLTKAYMPIDTVMYKMAEKIFENPDPIGINKINAQKYVDACEAYALAYDDDKASGYLYKASEMSRTVRTFPKTLSIYDWILQDYPDSEKAASSLFLKGFILENDLKNLDLAKTCYQQFLDKYPDHQLADDVKFLLENIGKSDEEIYKIIEKNKK
jgi:TolA-binding protein